MTDPHSVAAKLRRALEDHGRADTFVRTRVTRKELKALLDDYERLKGATRIERRHSNWKTTDYCAGCGESPESATHVLPGGHDYTPPKDKGLQAAIDNLADYTSNPGWDHAHASPIPRPVWDRVSGMCNAVKWLLPRLPEPFISPCADQSIVVSWTVSPELEFIVELHGDAGTEIAWEIHGAHGEFESGTDHMHHVIDSKLKPLHDEMPDV